MAGVALTVCVRGACSLRSAEQKYVTLIFDGAVKKSNICVARHPIVLAAYNKYASGHGIRDALILNFLRHRPKRNFLRAHHF
jgi:hypothetical protein